MKASALLLAFAALVSAAPALPVFGGAGADSQLAFNAAPLLSVPSIDSLGLNSDDKRRLQAHIDSLPEPRLIRLAEGQPPIAITEGQKQLLVGTRFVDVTGEEPLMLMQGKQEFPSKLTYSADFLKPVFDKIDTATMKAFLTKFSSFRTRHYRSETGKESQKFLLSTLKQIASTNKKVNITFTEFQHSWGQNSIIARFEPSKWKIRSGEESVVSDKIVIIGAHQDSTNLLPWLSAPGADDDGSGTTSNLMAFSALINSSFVPSTNPVEFHWYSAEEGGLLGSKGVANAYASQGKQVRAMSQTDMTAWVKAGTEPTVGIITDFVDQDFTAFIRRLVDEYVEISWTDTKCGYACSDHASWSAIGAPSAFSIESTFEDSNHNIHSSNDRIDYSTEFSFEHMAQFTRLAISIAVELGGGASLE